MRIFHMNLQNYNANTQFPHQGQATNKHQHLINTIHQENGNRVVDVAGFTEVFMANNVNQNNVANAFTSFSNALNIPNPRLISIRCGRSALQDSTEVVSILLRGDLPIAQVGILYNNGNGWVDREITHELNLNNNNYYYFYNDLQPNQAPDFRSLIYVNIHNNNPFRIGFIHNRQPGADQARITMQHIFNCMENGQNNNDGLQLVGGDFNCPPLFYNANNDNDQFNGGREVVYGNHHPIRFYSPGLTTTANPYDYWFSFRQLNDPANQNLRALSTSTNLGGGSDHKGIFLDFIAP